MDPTKVEAVSEWKRLETPIEVWSFLGLARYYQRFTSKFAKLASPLTQLTRKRFHLYGLKNVKIVFKN